MSDVLDALGRRWWIEADLTDRATAVHNEPISMAGGATNLALIEVVPASHLQGAVEENRRMRAFIAGKREIRFEARCKGLITVEEYVASLSQHPGGR